MQQSTQTIRLNLRIGCIAVLEDVAQFPQGERPLGGLSNGDSLSGNDQFAEQGELCVHLWVTYAWQRL